MKQIIQNFINKKLCVQYDWEHKDKNVGMFGENEPEFNVLEIYTHVYPHNWSLMDKPFNGMRTEFYTFIKVMYEEDEDINNISLIELIKDIARWPKLQAIGFYKIENNFTPQVFTWDYKYRVNEFKTTNATLLNNCVELFVPYTIVVFEDAETYLKGQLQFRLKDSLQTYALSSDMMCRKVDSTARYKNELCYIVSKTTYNYEVISTWTDNTFLVKKNKLTKLITLNIKDLKEYKAFQRIVYIPRCSRPDLTLVDEVKKHVFGELYVLKRYLYNNN